ncbi:MAG: AMP-binding protein, partial [Burkholderiaceae bacterium]
MKTPATSLWENLVAAERRWPRKPALVYFDRFITFSDLYRDARALAGGLKALGVKRGDRVMLVMQNTPQLVIAHFAILCANAVVVPVNPMNRADELGHCISDADAKVAIATGDLAAEVARARNALSADGGHKHLVVSGFEDFLDPSAVAAAGTPTSWRDWLLPSWPLPQLDNGEVHSWADLMARKAQPPEHVESGNDMALLPYTSGTT